MKLLLFLPLIIPLATAVAGLFAWNRRELQRLLGVCGTTALLGAGVALLTIVQRQGVVSVQAGNWPAPFGITLVADLFSAVMVVVAGAMGLAVAVYSLASADIEHESLGYHPLMQVLLLGVCGSLLTGDLFNLYVWFEVMLIASFVLLALGGRRQQMEGAIKYVALNLIASAFFLAGIGILYGVAGTLNMADLARQLRAVPHGGTVPVIAALLFAAFGIKSAVFPLFFWLPASYHTPPVAVTTIFSALLTKVGVYVLVRIFTLIFVQEAEAGRTLILAAAGLTMVTGVLGAVAQHEMRRLLSFHIVSQIGYLVMGLGLLTPLALAGTVFFMVHVIAAKSALFLVAGIVKRLTGTTELSELGGLYEGRPLVAGLFLVPAMALAGIPPLSGFWAKLALVRAGLGEGRYVVVAAALAVSILTLFSMTKIWAEAFWKDRPVREGEPRTHYHPHIPGGARLLLGGPAMLLALATVVMGVGAEPLFRLSLTAADQLLNPDLYIATVLGGETVTPFLANILLALAWMALTGTYTAGGFFTGVLVGFLVLWIARRGRGTTGYLTKVRAVAGFIAFFFRELVLANLRVAHDVLTPRHYMTPGILAVPLDVESDLEITVLATVISLTPGSLSLHLADDRRILYVHAMYVDDPEALVREIKEGFERRVREVFR